MRSARQSNIQKIQQNLEVDFEPNSDEIVFGIFLPKKAVLAETMVHFYSYYDLSMGKIQVKSIFRLVLLIGNFGRFLSAFTLNSPSTYFTHCDPINKTKNGKRSGVLAKLDMKGPP